MTEASRAAAPIQQVGTAADKTGLLTGTGAAPGSYRAAQEIGSASAAAPAAAASTASSAASPAGGFANGFDTGAATTKGWLERNQEFAGRIGGGVVEGLGKGLLASGQAEALTEKERMSIEAQQAEEARKVASHEPLTGLLRVSDVAANRAGQTPRPTPGERFDPRSYGGRFVYNPQTGRVEFVPNTAAA